MKFGFDLHGVITADPDTFRAMFESLIAAGHEIHIISGPPIEQIKKELEQLNIPYTHLFSIVDHHKALGTPMKLDSENTYWMEANAWNRTKGDYCAREGISLHLDDSDKYGEHFVTPYMQFFRNLHCSSCGATMKSDQEECWTCGWQRPIW